MAVRKNTVNVDNFCIRSESCNVCRKNNRNNNNNNNDNMKTLMGLCLFSHNLLRRRVQVHRRRGACVKRH